MALLPSRSARVKLNAPVCHKAFGAARGADQRGVPSDPRALDEGKK